MLRTLSIIPLAAALLALSACSGRDDSKPHATTATTTATVATSTAAPTSPSSPTPLPTVPTPTLGLRVVEVASGRNITLPVEFGRASAWSRDSSFVAVAGAGLAVGRTDGTPFRSFWPTECYGVEWSPSADLVGAICKDAVVILGASGEVVVTAPVSNSSFSSKQPLVAWSPDGALLAYGPIDGRIRFLAVAGQPPPELDGTSTGFQWMADGRLVSFEQPYYQSPAVARLHDPGAAFRIAAEFTSPAGAYGTGVDARTGLLAYALYGSQLPGSRVLESTTFLVNLVDGRNIATFENAYLAEYNSGPSFGLGGRLAAMANFCDPPSWTVDALYPDGTRSAIARGGAMRIEFSPDGKWLAFTRGITLWVAAVDGSVAPRQVADDVHGPAEFSWSPDSRWISIPPFFGGFDQCL